MTSRTTVVQPPPSERADRPRRKLTLLPEPPRPLDMQQQMPFIAAAILELQHFYSDQDDVQVGSGGYLCQTPGSRSDLYVPDFVMVRLEEDIGSIAELQGGYVIDEIGKPPDLVLEVGSPSTGRLDYTTKRDGYARLRVGEYWRFDASGGEYHDRPLAGDLLVDDEYQPIDLRHEPDGSIWGRSVALGLDIYWQDGNLRFYDYEKGAFLLEYHELDRERELAEARAARAESRADTESEARARAEARAASLEAEIERLRADGSSGPDA